MTGAMRVGLDIGATKILGVAVDPDGRVVAQVRTPTPSGGDAVVAAAAEVVDKLRAETGSGPAHAVGVGVPGLVDTARGTLQNAVNLGVNEDWFPLGAALSERIDAAVVVDNDANAAALGVARRTDHDDLAYLSIGTGLAAALVLGGRIRRGLRGAAGEIGHIPVDPAGPRCPCGQVGCLETFASGSAVAAAWPTASGPRRRRSSRPPRTVTPRRSPYGTRSPPGWPTRCAWSPWPSTRRPWCSAGASPTSATRCWRRCARRWAGRPPTRPS